MAADGPKASFHELLVQLQSVNDEREQELLYLRTEIERYKASGTTGEEEDWQENSPPVPEERKALEDFEDCADDHSTESLDEASRRWRHLVQKVLLMQSLANQVIAKGLVMRDLWKSDENWRNTAYLEEVKEESIRAAAQHSALQDILEEQLVEKPAYSFLLSPHGPKRVFWDFLSMVLLFYDIVNIPLTAFDPDRTTFTDGMDWTTQIFWTLDIGMSLVTGFVREGKVNMNPRAILINYLKTWFILDVIVCGPDWISTIVEFMGPDATTDPGGVNRLLRALRVVRTVRLLRLVKLKRVLAMIKDRITSEAVFILVNICRMILMLLLVNHFIAAAFYLIGSIGEENSLSNWLEAYKMRKGDQDLFFRYSTSLHWSLTQFTPASMDVHPQNVAERCFAIMVLIAGLVLFSSFISSITGSMSQLRNMQADKSKQFWLLRRYLKQQKVPMDLCFRVLRYVEYAMSNSHDRVPEGRITILSSLTEQLRNELTFYTRYRNLKKHPVFTQIAGVNEAILNRMSGRTINSVDLAAGDPLFSLVDAVRSMFFIEGGSIRYTIQDSGTKSRRTIMDGAFEPEADPSSVVLGQADYLCEAGLWSSLQHLGVAQAISEASLICVDIATFCELVQKDIELRETLMLYAHRFVDYMNSHNIQWVEVSTEAAKDFTSEFFKAY